MKFPKKFRSLPEGAVERSETEGVKIDFIKLCKNSPSHFFYEKMPALPSCGARFCNAAWSAAQNRPAWRWSGMNFQFHDYPIVLICTRISSAGASPCPTGLVISDRGKPCPYGDIQIENYAQSTLYTKSTPFTGVLYFCAV